MTAYQRSEIIASSKLAKRLGAVLSNLTSGRSKRIVISRNNILEAVILPVEDYEKLENASDTLEHIEVARIIARRAREKATVSLEKLLSEEGIHLDET
jgi:PHD/YefM family antitoxin component YafN of YafNO toxin-antitoxin module